MVSSTGKTKSGSENGQIKPMKNGVQYFKYSVWLLTVIAVIYLFHTCNCTKPAIKEVPVIKVKIDTQWLPQKDSISYVPKPYKVSVPVPYAVIDSFIETVVERVDTAQLLKQFYSTLYYSDSQPIKYGSVTINDTVSKNKIQGRGLIINQNLPVITKTITEIRKRRNVLMVGVEAMGNKNTPLYATGVNAGIFSKRERYIGFKGVVLKGGEGLIGVDLKWPIKTKRAD